VYLGKVPRAIRHRVGNPLPMLERRGARAAFVPSTIASQARRDDVRLLVRAVVLPSLDVLGRALKRFRRVLGNAVSRDQLPALLLRVPDRQLAVVAALALKEKRTLPCSRYRGLHRIAISSGTSSAV
jgi:hypothetical protein